MLRFSLVIFFWVANLAAIGQKRFSEGSITFSVLTFNNQNVVADSLIAQHIVKGAHIRTDLIGAVGKAVTIYDSREGVGAVLREFGAQKILIPLDAFSWEDKNAWAKSSSISFVDEQRDFLGYACKKAILQLQNGALLHVYYTPDVILDNSDAEFQLNGIPGLVMFYEYIADGKRVRYESRALNFDPVPIQRFDIPNSGYRILTYAESKKQ